VTLVDSRVGRDLVTTSGEVSLQGASAIAGDLVIRKSTCWGWCWSDDKATRVVIGAGASGGGEIRIEHEAELWVHEQARIGRVTGAEVKRFNGERP
jgi:hypothetical protein